MPDSYTTLVDSAVLARHLDDPAWAIVDCRHSLADTEAGEREYLAGHIPGARFLHLERDLSGARTGSNGRHPLPDRAAFTTALRRIGIDASTQVVAYDQNTGLWASRLWWMLRQWGHGAVAVLDGGLDKWIAESGPVDQATPGTRTGNFEARGAPATASASEILERLDDPDLLVLDARARDRFRGDFEPLDPVAGHIPGARNRPLPENLGPTGTFKTSAALRSEFEALLAGASSTFVVHQCGSGVTACHNALAMEHAGLPGSRVYPGSWSEWSADPRRPVARGD